MARNIWRDITNIVLRMESSREAKKANIIGSLLN